MSVLKKRWRAFVVGGLALLSAACAAQPPDAGRHQAALAESPELTLRVVNTHGGAIRLTGPGGNTFDILEGESVDLRFVVVALADFEEALFRAWLVPAGPVVQRIVELDEPGLMHTVGLDIEIQYLAPDRSRQVIRGTARRCPGAGWRAPGVSGTDFVVRTAAASSAPIPLCPGTGA
ncbi:MAG: hypothetical protein O3C65_15930 [Proteobacteria bacterium]|nr:hypothetical protein [Pseudomonadota bacterium]